MLAICQVKVYVAQLQAPAACLLCCMASLMYANTSQSSACCIGTDLLLYCCTCWRRFCVVASTACCCDYTQVLIPLSGLAVGSCQFKAVAACCFGCSWLSSFSAAPLCKCCMLHIMSAAWHCCNCYACLPLCIWLLLRIVVIGCCCCLHAVTAKCCCCIFAA